MTRGAVSYLGVVLAMAVTVSDATGCEVECPEPWVACLCDVDHVTTVHLSIDVDNSTSVDAINLSTMNAWTEYAEYLRVNNPGPVLTWDGALAAKEQDIRFEFPAEWVSDRPDIRNYTSTLPERDRRSIAILNVLDAMLRRIRRLEAECTTQEAPGWFR